MPTFSSRCPPPKYNNGTFLENEQPGDFYSLMLPLPLRRSRFLGGDGTEEMALYRVSGHLYTVSFESNLGDLVVRSFMLARRRPQRPFSYFIHKTCKSSSLSESKPH